MFHYFNSNFILFALLSLATSRYAAIPTCRCLPIDDCWPQNKDWQALNHTVGGRLIATVPLGASCHDPVFNSTECAILQAGWAFPQTHFNSPSSFVVPYFQNQSCDPFTPRSRPCLLGNYVDYAINITNAQDIAAGLRFAEQQNIRVVIKNTGHDLLGKSTGKGALGIWMHNLKDIDFLEYRSQFYTGSAVKLGAGVQAFEAFAAADTRGLRIIGGTCPTVGLAGGYTQGAGHGMLSSFVGFSADHTLEWEVVKADGSLVTASPTENPDLYWALSGGGGGTYGVVLSLTVKTFPDGIMGGATISYNSTGIAADAFWDSITRWHESLPAIVDNGGTAAYILTKESFFLQQATFPGFTVPQVKLLMQPFLAALDELQIPFTHDETSFPTFVTHYNHYVGLPFGTDPSNEVCGSRLLPRSVVAARTNDVTAALRSITADPRFTIIGLGLNVSHAVVGNTPASNSVLPAWRDTLLHILISGAWNYALPQATNELVETATTRIEVPDLEALSPDSGAYLNEANFAQPNWQKDFYGINYARLQKVKKIWDPTNLFYAITAVGSEAWVEDADGRLCRTEL